MAAINLDRMSLKELVDLQDKLEKAILSARDRERSDVKQKVEALVQTAGFSVNELFGGRGKTKAVVPKYVNPDNRTETWTGRGRKPNWLVTRLSKGAKMEDFAIR
jgi:DNA-binding protein H-NS